MSNIMATNTVKCDMKHYAVINHLMSEGCGILAIDESANTLGERFTEFGIDNTEETRKRYRENLLSGDLKYLSGVILHKETVEQTTSDGISFVKKLLGSGILPGVKLDDGLIPFRNCSTEKLTNGLEYIDAEVAKYYNLGCQFGKWRCVFAITEVMPTEECIQRNTEDLAKFAVVCLSGGMIPVLEPEVLLVGDHSIDRTIAVTKSVLSSVVYQLNRKNVPLEAVFLKISMVLPGSQSVVHCSMDEIADATIQSLKSSIPTAIAGIMFLSGGQNYQTACENISAIVRKVVPKSLSPITFCFSRALQEGALANWIENDKNAAGIDNLLGHRLMKLSDAIRSF